MNFSQRNGLKPIRTIIQKESIDEELTTALWNCLTIYYFNDIEEHEHETNANLNTLLRRLWLHYFKYKLDEFPYTISRFKAEIKRYFFTVTWNEVFDIIEFIISNYTEEYKQEKNGRNFKFIELANSILEQHISAYRIIDFLITEITGDAEISSIEKALA